MSSAAANSTTVASTTVENAVAALLKWKESKSSTEKLKLLPDDEFIYLILTLKKIPPKPRTNAYKIPLPHPLYSSPSLCLIVDDRSGAKPTSDTVKQIIVAQNLNVGKVIKLSKLKSNYKAFEAKRKLCDSYDLFLADKRIVHFLPKLLGGMFFKKKKLPVPVDMGKNWRGKVESAVSDGLLYFRTGTCCVMKVGRGSMEKEEIVENVVRGVDGVVEFVPKKWGGVRSLHLKMADSVALPLYQALPDLKLRIEGVSAEVEGGDEAKSESLTGDGDGDGLGSERKSGGKKKKDKGRIREVRYMDVGLIEEEFGNEDSDGDEENEMEVREDEGEQTGKKRKKEEIDDVVSEDEIDDVGVMKTKKGKGVKRQIVSPMDGAKPVKARKQIKEKKLEDATKVINESAVKKVKEKSELAAKKGERKQIKEKKLESVKPKKVIDEPALKKASKKSELGAKKKQGSAMSKEKRSKTRVSA